MQSPEYVQTSLAAAITLGLEPGKFARDVELRGLNLLLTYDKGCAARCSFCGLSGDRALPDEATDTFIRVKWPIYTLDEILARVRANPRRLERVCVSMITRPEALADTVTIVRRLRAETDLLISVLITPAFMHGTADLQQLKDAGADMVGIAVDCATEELFYQHRRAGKLLSWEHYWQTLADAVAVFDRFKVGVHLIVGLGESEREMIATIQRAHDMGVGTHLFSFFPEAGTRLQNHLQPPAGQYRRVQLARYIVDEELGRLEGMAFNAAGQVTSFGVDVEPLLAKAEAFETSGCEGKSCKVACNRPFGNERPSKPFRNFPMHPETEDIALIRTQLWEGIK